MKDKDTSIVKNSFKYGIGSIVQRSIGLFLMPIYTRIFVPADYGVVNVVFTAASLLTALLSLGMAGAFFRYYHEYDEKGKILLISTIQLSRLFATLLVCVTLSIISTQLSNILLGSGQYYVLILLSLGTIIFSVMSNLSIDIFRVQFKVMWYNVLRIGGLLLQVILSITLVILLRYNLFGLFLSHLLAGFIVCVLALWMVRALITFRVDFGILRKLLVFGVGELPGLFMYWITASSDRIFLSRYANLSDVGIYGISNQLASIVRFTHSAFGTAWLPVAYRDFRKDESPHVFRKVGLYYVMVLCFAALVCSLFSSDAIHILTPKTYHRSYLYVPILAYSLILSGIGWLVGEGLYFANKPYYRSISALTGALLNFGLNFYFIPRYQILGASITTLLAYLASLLVAYFLAGKFYPRIRHNLGKMFLICGYSVIFVIIGFFIDREYSFFNIFYKVAILVLAVCGAVAIFLKNEAKQLIEQRFSRS